MSEHKRSQFAESMVGKRLEVVLQTAQDDGAARGITDNYLEVTVENACPQLGQLVDVTITQTHGAGLRGSITEDLA